MSELILSDGTRSIDFLSEPRGNVYVQADGIQLPVVSRENTYAEGSDSEGRSRVRSRALNSEAGSFSVFFQGANATEFWDAVDDLQELVESAHKNKGALTYTPPGGVAVTFDLESVGVSELPQRGVLLRQFHGEATVTVETKPYGRLAEQSFVLQDSYPEVLMSHGNVEMLLPMTAPAAYEGPTGSRLRDVFAPKQDGPVTAALTGQSYGQIIGGTTPPNEMEILNGEMTNDGVGSGSAATYSEVQLPGNVTKIGCKFKLSSGGITGGVVLIICNESTEINGIIPDGPCHLFIGPSTWAMSVIDGAIVDTVASGSYTLTADTEYTAEVQIDGSGAALFLPNGQISYVTDPRIASLAGAWAMYEVYASDASADAKGRFTQLWADTGSRTVTDGLADISGNSRNGTAANSAGASTDGPLGSGDEGAFSFNGTSQYVTTTYNPFTNGTTRTFFAWVKRDTTAAIHTIFGGSAASNAPHLRLASGSNDIVFLPDHGAAGVTWTGAAPGTGVWFLVALEFDEGADTAELWINGVSQTSKAAATAYNATPGNLRIAARNTSSFLMDGGIAYLGVLTTTLSDAEHLALYKAGSEGAFALSLGGPIAGFGVEHVSGQLSALGNLSLTDTVSQARNHVEVGVQHDYDPNNPEPLLLKAVTDLTALGGSSNTRSGSHSTNIIRAALTTSPVAVCTSDEQPHEGAWKVRARVYPSATTVRVRLAWRAGDGPFANEKWVTVPNEDGWYDLDLGSVNIKELPSGHTSEFRVEAMTTSGVPTVDVDYITLMPADNYTKLRGSSTEDTPTGAAVAAEDFSTHSSAALAGTTPLLVPSGTWTASGTGSGTFYTVASTLAYSEASSDSSLTTDGVFARLGSGTLTNGYVTAKIETDHINYLSGVFARYSATNNWLIAGFTRGSMFTARQVTLIKNVAGVVTTISSVPTNDRYIYLSASSTGIAAVLTSADGYSWTWRILTSTDADIATGGGIASGGYGIYHACTDSTSARAEFDDIAVVGTAGVSSVTNPAINSTESLSLTHNTALTATSTSTGTTPIREGKYLTLPPSTRNNTASRVVVRARRDDIDTGFADTGLTDELTASLSVTPRVHLTGS